MLTPQEAESLFETLRAMADEGRTVIFISHKLHEVKAVSDRVTVLRGGKTVDDGRDGGRDAALARRADGRARGRAASAAASARCRHGDECRCSSSTTLGRAATAAARRCAASRSRVRAGEIVAIAGVAGNGQRELAETITGHAPADRAGACASAGERLRGGDAREAIRAGVAHVPEDRLRHGRRARRSASPRTSCSSRTARRPLSRGPLLASARSASAPRG